jgi:hypothetical protein
MTTHTFDVYGRYRIRVRQDDHGWWIAERSGTDGKRRRVADFGAPPDTDLDGLSDYVEAFYHEIAPPGGEIRLVESGPNGTGPRP